MQWLVHMSIMMKLVAVIQPEMPSHSAVCLAAPGVGGKGGIQVYADCITCSCAARSRKTRALTLYPLGGSVRKGAAISFFLC